MKKKLKCLLYLLICGFVLIGVSGCDSSSSKSSDWEKAANEANYYKKNGKWYYQGRGQN